MTKWYFFFQPIEQGDWHLGLADERDNITRKGKPPFTTILDVDNNFEEDILPDDVYKTHYRGRFYIDLDSEDPQEVIDQFKLLLRKLEGEKYGVDLSQVELYATGGRGFHLLFDPKMFNKSLPARGTPMLPMVYKEMAFELYVDTLDLNIYSTKRGRMFREPNVQRTNDKYKVQITVEEAKEMTVGMYKEICSRPRPLFQPKAPEYNSALGLLYTKAEDKIGRAIKDIKSRKGDAGKLSAFKDNLPTVLSAVMNGETLAEGAGFQKIATQLAITAHALEHSEEQFLAECQGLIDNHVGDGNRYNNPAKRKAELSRMYRYMANNPSYHFSFGGLRSIMDKKVDISEIEHAGKNDADAPEPDENGIPHAITQGVRVSEKGIFRKTEDGIQQVCALGMSNPKQLLDIETGDVHGYEVDVFIEGKPAKPKTVTMDCFASRNAFMKFTLAAGSCNVSLTDSQIGAIADIMRHRVEQSGQKVYTVRREGIDVLTTPTGELDVIWADQFGVVSNLDNNYRLTGSLTDALAFRTDLRQAPDLVDSKESREFFDHLFEINDINVVARCFAWFTSCFISQPIRHMFNQFPSLQVYGPMGSGKSTTTRLFAQMHYYKQTPVTQSALDATHFVYDNMASSGGSVPFVLDEFKPREMRRDRFEKAKGILRSNYNGDAISKGSVDKSTGQSQLVVTSVANRSPIAIIAEALFTQSAYLERCVVVPIEKEMKEGRRDHLEYCREHTEIMAAFGKACADRARGVQFDGLRDSIKQSVNKIRGEVGKRADANERPIFNMAIMMTALIFARRVMHSAFGELYNEQFNAMMQALEITDETLMPTVMSEAAKFMNDLAYLSRYNDDPRWRLNAGEDYVLAGDSLFLKLKNCFVKYAIFKRSTGGEAMYDNYESFYSAMTIYPAVESTTCVGSPLKDSPATAVFQFDVVKLQIDGVESFHEA